MRHNLPERHPSQSGMERDLKAIIQQYMQRMNGNRLVIE